MIPHLVPEIEGGCPERDGGAEEEEEEGQGLGDSRRFIQFANTSVISAQIQFRMSALSQLTALGSS